MRMIDADALLDAMRDEEFQTFVPLDEIYGVIDKAPTIGAEPVKHGAWETSRLYDGDGNVVYIRRHKECNYDYHGYKEHGTSYCPNCGAKMDLVEGNAHEKSDCP